MESLDAKKVRLLGRWLVANKLYIGQHGNSVVDATSIITLLDEIEQAYYTSKEIADAETHAYERYPDAD